MATVMGAADRSWLAPVGAGALWVGTYLVSRGVLDAVALVPAARVAVALVPLVPAAWFLWLVVSGIRSLDELERRVHLEALAIAFPLGILLLMTLGLLQLAVDLNPDDWSYRHVWVYLPVFYFIGLALAWRRYR